MSKSEGALALFFVLAALVIGTALGTITESQAKEDGIYTVVKSFNPDNTRDLKITCKNGHFPEHMIDPKDEQVLYVSCVN
jgi:hypothetical protein